MESPCIKVCRIDAVSRLCSGCGRTMDEIATWASLSDTARRDVMLTLADRMRRAGLTPPAGTGTAGAGTGTGTGTDGEAAP